MSTEARSTGQGVSLERKLVAALGTTVLGLLTLCGFLALRLWDRSPLDGIDSTQELLDNPELKAEVVRLLVNDAGGDWDSHSDPDVGRVMRPKSNKLRDKVRFAANRMGLREREYALPKPEGVVRVVILGDSYVYGTHLPAEDRAGPLLEDYLERGANLAEGSVEVLHLGLISWNYLAETSYLRRHASLLQPDLVIHLTVPNDIDDCYGVRGFGVMSKFSPQQRARADSLVQYSHPRLVMGIGKINYLTFGLDHESLQRYARAAEEIQHLRRVLAGLGCEYLHLFRWDGNPKPITPLLLPDLPENRLAHLSTTFSTNTDHWVREDDNHFGPEGMEVLAKFLYGVIEDRGLLPMLELEDWPAANITRRRMEEEAALDLAQDYHLPTIWPIDGRLDFTPLDEEDATHFNGGADAEGRLSPYASFTFRPATTNELTLRGRGLDRPELAGVTLTVKVDGTLVDTFRPGQGEEILKSWPIPESHRGQEFLNVTVEADDYVYVGDDLQHCVSFQLEELFIQ